MTNAQHNDLCRVNIIHGTWANYYFPSNTRKEFLEHKNVNQEYIYTSKENPFIVDSSSINLKRIFWFTNEARIQREQMVNT